MHCLAAGWKRRQSQKRSVHLLLERASLRISSPALAWPRWLGLTRNMPASDAGMFLVNPSQRGQAGAGELMRKMAEAGLSCAFDFELGMEGGGEMAAMMSQMGKSTMSNETVSVTTDTLDAALFAIPDGYTVKNQ